MNRFIVVIREEYKAYEDVEADDFFISDNGDLVFIDKQGKSLSAISSGQWLYVRKIEAPNGKSNTT